MANATCFTPRAPFQGPPLIQNGVLTFQAHHVGWIITGFFAVVATAASFWLIDKHLMWYTMKRQQRYIVRLLLMVPIYATVSLASYVFWNHALPITLLRDSYESFVLYSFFYLLLQYLSPTTEGQKEVFRHVVLEKWLFPLGFVKYRPADGLYFLQLMKWGILQYCIVRPTTTLVAVILDFVGLYCVDSWRPGWGHVYITTIVSLSVSIAMYCLFALYVPVAKQLAPHKPLLKLFSVKAVVFLTFWQATGLSALSIFGVVKDTKYMTAEDINTGIAAILETFEMMCFAFLHVRAFSYRPYRPEGHKSSDQTPRLRSFMHALDVRDMWREVRDGSVYMGRTIRGVEADEGARRRIHFSKVMGREREFSEAKTWTKEGGAAGDARERDLFLDKHRRGSGHGGKDISLNEPGDRLGGAFADELDKEVPVRELTKVYKHGDHHDSDLDDLDQGHTRGRHSRWRGMYDRLVQSGPEREREERFSPVPFRPSQKHRPKRHGKRDSSVPSLDSPPPQPSVMFEYSTTRDGRSSVQLSHSHKLSGGGLEHRAVHEAPAEPLPADHSHHHKASLPGLPRDRHRNVSHAETRSAAHVRPLATARPLFASQVNHIELQASGDARLPSTAGQASANDHDNDRLVAHSGMLRSDSLLARVFPDATFNTVDGHASSEGMSKPASSRDTHSTRMIYPSPLSFSVDAAPPIRTRRAGPFSTPVPASSIASQSSMHVQSSQLPPTLGANQRNSHSTVSPTRGRRRPNIVLPAPLSPVRYRFESPRHGHSPPQYARRLSLQSQQPLPHSDQSATTSFTHAWSAHQANFERAQLGPRLPDPPETSGSSCHHSRQFEPTLSTQPRAVKQLPAPPVEYVAAVHSSTAAFRTDISRDDASHAAQTALDGNMLPGRSMSSDPSRFPISPTGSGLVPNFTTPPSSTPLHRPLRRSRDDVGKGRRPWS